MSPSWKFQAPHTTSTGSPPASTVDPPDAVRPGDGADLEDACQHDVTEALPDAHDLLDDEAEVVEGRRQRRRGRPRRGR